MVYLIPFVAGVFVVLWCISVYFVKTGKMTGQDWSKRSLGLPQGSVRALLALIILFLLIFSMVEKTQIPTELPEWLVGILGTIIGFYFGAAMVPKAPSQSSKPDEGTKPEAR
jgi:glycerol uptake facilitator-like aquaporin